MTDKDSIKTTVNERAKFAYECVKKVATYEKEEFKNNYKSYAKKLMAIIKTNGLGATLAFMKAKGSSAYQELYNNIDSWLKSENCPVSSLYSNSTADMVEKIISLEKLIELLNLNAAKIFGIGAEIKEGQPADLTVFDLNNEYKINSNEFLSMGKSTPFEGKNVFGKCLMTVADGKIVWKA